MTQVMNKSRLLTCLFFVFSTACGGSGNSGGSGAAAGAGGSGATGSTGGTGGGTAAAPGWQLGTDGTAAAVTFVEMWEPPIAKVATDLDFNPVRPGELWVTMQEFYDGSPCTSTVKQGCISLEGSVLVVSDASGAAPVGVIKKDVNAWHFMRRPSSIAFGVGDSFATCGDARTGNFEDSPIDYSGPTWWSSDPNIFGKTHPVPPGETFTPNGAHLDMLHGTPFCMGIAHEKDSIYWCLNGQIGALDRYNFNQPHPPGGEDHSDGEMYRHLEGSFARLEKVPSHMELDKATGLLYVADAGNKRVALVDTNTGTVNGTVVVQDNFAVKNRVDGTVISDFIPAGTLEAPSGIALGDGVVFVSDHATSRIHAFDMTGQLLKTLDTGMPPGTLSGIAVGPEDKKLYFVDMLTSRVRRIDPLP
jgi:hypothetical protein